MCSSAIAWVRYPVMQPKVRLRQGPYIGNLPPMTPYLDASEPQRRKAWRSAPAPTRSRGNSPRRSAAGLSASRP
jgi:hypothetical protein